jgi:DNA-binding LacI/PurR family transcriptional regulator
MVKDPQPKTKDNSKEATRNRPPTSLDVARLANVSRATVSYVLNDVEDAQISEATKERVLQAAAELGYIPHKIASSLRSGRSDLVLLPFFNWPYNQSSITFLQELALRLEQLGYSVMLYFFERDDKESLARKIASFHPIGVIVGANELTRTDVELLSRNGVRAVLAYESPSDPFIPSLSVDFAVVGECVGEHLMAAGHRQIAAIVPKDERILHMGLQRLEGLKTAGKRAGITIERVDLGYDINEACSLASKWKAGPRPTGIFTYNDEYGMLLMGALQDVGLNIPGDIALVGCDNLPLCEMVRPKLSSVNMDPEEQAKDMVAYFHQMILGQASEIPPSFPMACQVIVRETG